MIERIIQGNSITDVKAAFNTSNTILIQTTKHPNFQHKSFTRLEITFDYFQELLKIFLEAEAYKILVCSKENSKKIDLELLFKHNILVVTN